MIIIIFIEKNVRNFLLLQFGRFSVRMVPCVHHEYSVLRSFQKKKLQMLFCAWMMKSVRFGLLLFSLTLTFLWPDSVVNLRTHNNLILHSSSY